MKLLRNWLEVVICCILAALTAVVFCQVLARYVFQAPLSWSEELARFLLMWLSMLSAAYAFRKGSHFALRIVLQRLPVLGQWIVSILVQIIVAGFFLLLTYQGVIFVAGVSGHLAPALQIPMEIPYASVVVGSGLIVWESLRAAVLLIINRPETLAKPEGR